jgi:hypothetical protein
MANTIDLVHTYDASDTNAVSVAPGVHNIDPVNNFLQRFLPKVRSGAMLREWIEDTRVKVLTTLASTMSTTNGTTMNVASGDGAAVFPNVGAGTGQVSYLCRIGTEYVLATSASTDAITVTRGYNSSTAATHAANVRIQVIGPVHTEGKDADLAVSTVRTKPNNQIQLFMEPIHVSGQQEAVDKYGGVTSEIDYQTVKAMGMASEHLEMSLFWSTLQNHAANTPGLMNGFYNLITTNRTADTGTVDEAAIQADILSIWDEGSVPQIIIAAGKVCQDIAALYSDRIRSDVTVNTGGAQITAVIDVLGGGPIIVMPHRLLEGEYFMLNLNAAALVYLRPFFLKDLADDGDADKRTLIGDYTLELHNEKGHAYRSFDGY